MSRPKVEVTYTPIWNGDGSVARLMDLRLTVDGRPLVVIDPEDREQVERLWNAQDRAIPLIREQQGPGVVGVSLVDALQVGLRIMLDPSGIPELPKPDEPQGLGAVLEATCGCNRELRRFVRDPAARDFSLPRDAKNVARGVEVPWVAPCGHHRYSDLTAVRVLSEGVTS